MNPVGSEQDQRCGQNGRRQYQQYKKRTAYSISAIMYVAFFVVFRLSVLFSGMALLRRSSASEIQLSLQRRDQIPDQADGMRQPVGISEQKIQDEACSECCCMINEYLHL